MFIVRVRVGGCLCLLVHFIIVWGCVCVVRMFMCVCVCVCVVCCGVLRVCVCLVHLNYHLGFLIDVWQASYFQFVFLVIFLDFVFLFLSRCFDHFFFVILVFS